MKTTPHAWNSAAKPSAPGFWVEAMLPNGGLAVAKRTELGWVPTYPAGTPVAWRLLHGHRFRVFPRPTVRVRI